MLYVDGYVLPVPTKKLAAYRSMAKKAAKVFIAHGALEVRECIGDDLDVKFGLPFPKVIKPKKGETIMFSWITYKSRQHRDRVNASVMKDPKMHALCPAPEDMPFDCKRMLYGGFKAIVEA